MMAESYDGIELHSVADDEWQNKAPTTTLRLFRRRLFGKKHYFVPENTDEAEYYVENRVPHKHSDTWKPVFHRGDDPKYEPLSKETARSRRTAMWSSFRIELGDGVAEILDNERRARERMIYEFQQKWRRRLRMRLDDSDGPRGDQMEVFDFVMALGMRRCGFFSRTMKWEWMGEEYRWTGTRRFLPGWAKTFKGLSHDFKVCLIDPDLERCSPVY